jgi:hypothetical protein
VRLVEPTEAQIAASYQAQYLREVKRAIGFSAKTEPAQAAGRGRHERAEVAQFLDIDGWKIRPRIQRQSTRLSFGHERREIRT